MKRGPSCRGRKTERHLSHHRTHIPHINALIPPNACAPPLAPKKTPIHARHKFCMSVHPSQLRAHNGRRPRPHEIRVPDYSGRRLIAPSPTGHIIARAQQYIRQMRRPSHPSNRVVMSDHNSLRPLLRSPYVERPDRPVHAGHRNNRRPILVPVMGQRFRWRTCGGWCPGVSRYRRGRCRVDGDLEGKVV